LDGYSANRHYHRDTILIHDALADLNQPFYFHEFIAWAEQYQLQYLGEAEFPAMMPANFAENVANKIGHYAKNVIETEQYIDFVRNTTFRRTLLCHQEIPLAREIKPEVIENFKLASFANTLVAPDENPLDAILDPTKAQVFTLGDGTKFATVHTFTKAAFHHLLSISPLSIDFAGLVEAVCAKLNISEASFEDVNLLAASLLQAHSYSMQFLELQMYAPHFVVEVSPYPEVNPYGRLTMRGVQAVNMRHELVELTTTGAKLLPYVDGTRSHEDLLNILLDLFDQGKLVLEHLGSQVQDRYLAEELLIEELNVTLKHFALSALLVA
jgi:methyltransferase-like protein